MARELGEATRQCLLFNNQILEVPLSEKEIDTRIHEDECNVTVLPTTSEEGKKKWLKLKA